MNDHFTQQKSLLEIAQKYTTPVYVYDAQCIYDQYQKLQKAFSQVPLKIKYACKALSNINILKLLHSWGSGLDVVSLNEMELGLLAGFSPQDIIFTPNSIDFSEIITAYNKNIVINIDSISILQKFTQYFPDGVCSLRFNPNIVAGGNINIQTGHSASKFGIPKSKLPEVLALVANSNVTVIGLHIHAGSDITEPQKFLEIANVMYEIAKDFRNLKFLNMGSGFKVAYKPGEQSIDVEQVARQIIPGFQEFCSRYNKNLELWFEPGKYMVSAAGFLLVKVTQIKTNGNKTFACVNSGQNHLIRPMFYKAYHEIVNLSNPQGQKHVYDIVGYICEEDTFAAQREIAEISEGDILCIKNAGAYGFSMSSNYNSRCRPPEVLIYKEKDYLIRQQESLEDILRHQIILDNI